MTLEKLQELLKSGVISQEEYDELSKSLESKTPPTQPPAGTAEPEKKPETPPDDLDTRIQQIVDRATNKLGNDNKLLKEQLEKERKKNLTAEELKQVELQEKEAEILKKEREIQERENRMYAVKAIKKAGLDEGEENILDFVDFVLGEDETAIDARVKSLTALINAKVKRGIEKVYKENGREPGKGNAGGSKDNPWNKDSWNLTRQMEMEINNPEMAKTLKASAGQ